MTQLYLSKSITAASTGIVSTAWVISDWQIRNNIDPTKISISVNVSGYVTPAAFANGLNSVPGTRFFYRLNSTNFPTGTDLTTVNITELYNAILAVITESNTDPLNGAVLASL